MNLPAVTQRVLLVLAWSVSGALAILSFEYYVLASQPNDAHAYWVAARAANPYALPPGMDNAFLYSPAVAQLLHAAEGVPWSLFLWGWRLIEALLFAWLVAPLPVRWAVPLWLACVPEILLGNIVGLTCAAVVLGIRRPEAWAFPLLTKVVPGVLGLLYLVAARRWRGCSRAVLATAVVAGLSFLVDPGLWNAWIDFLLDQQSDNGNRVARTLAACALVVAAAKYRRPWLLAPALLVSTPVLVGLEVIAYLAAIPRLQLSAATHQTQDVSTADDAGRAA